MTSLIRSQIKERCRCRRQAANDWFPTSAHNLSSCHLIVPFWSQANYLHLFRERLLIRTFSGEITDRKYRPPPKAVFIHTSLFVQVRPQIRYCGLSPKSHLEWTLFIQSTQVTTTLRFYLYLDGLLFNSSEELQQDPFFAEHSERLIAEKKPLGKSLSATIIVPLMQTKRANKQMFTF